MKKSLIVSVLFALSACGPVGGAKSADAGRLDSQKLAAKLDAGGSSTSTSSALSVNSAVMRHLPGTVITTATGKYVYLVNGDATVSTFASDKVLTDSGYTPNMVVTVSADELHCYGRGSAIAKALPMPASGMLRDGVLVKEKTRSAVYVVSEGIAWPVRNSNVLTASGYNLAVVKTVADNSLANAVDGIGDCASGIACLDEDFLASCAEEENGTIDLSTGTATATGTGTTVYVNVGENTVPADAGVSAVVDTGTGTVVTTATATATKTVPTATATSTVTAVGISPDAGIDTSPRPDVGAETAISAKLPDLSWVYATEGTELCLNSAYFSGGERAVLLIWDGPAGNCLEGPVALKANGRFCWDFANRETGLYRFWVDAPVGSCAKDVCARDTIPNNGAQYMTAPKVTGSKRAWLNCEPTGCDGMAYWDGETLVPAGNQ